MDELSWLSVKPTRRAEPYFPLGRLPWTDIPAGGIGTIFTRSRAAGAQEAPTRRACLGGPTAASCEEASVVFNATTSIPYQISPRLVGNLFHAALDALGGDRTRIYMLSTMRSFGCYAAPKRLGGPL